MQARSKARRRALDVLYEAEVRGIPARAVLAERLVPQPDRLPLGEYVAPLVEGVEAHRARIDELLSTYSRGWSLDRMPALDRNILRVGAYELLWAQDVPAEVVLDEAATIAAELSTDESPDFVHGLLGRLRDLKPSLVTPTEPVPVPDATDAPDLDPDPVPDALPVPDVPDPDPDPVPDALPVPVAPAPGSDAVALPTPPGPLPADLPAS